MSCMTVERLCVIGVICLLLTACASSPSRSPFPTLGALSQGEKAQVIRSRTMGLKTLAAVLAMTFTGGKQQDTFDMIVNYDATGKMRFTAFKDVGFNTRPIFDLLFAGERYRLETHDEAGMRTHQGSVSQFVQNHPPFRAFLLVGEAFFLPGFDGRGNPPVLSNTTASRFTTQLKSGATAQWFARPDTLEITKARIEAGDDSQGATALLLRYSDYRQVEAYYLPGRVTLLDRRLDSTTQALLKQVEVNIPLVPGIFDLPATPKEQLRTHTASSVRLHLKTP